MKKNKNLLTKVLLVMCGSIILPSVSHAQWAVTNVNDQVYYPMYFGPTGIFTRSMGQMLTGVKGAVDSVRETQAIAIKQQDMNQYDADVRTRMAMGSADIARRDFEELPTIAKCVELSSRGVATGAAAGAFRTASGGGGTSSGKQNFSARAQQITNTATAQAAVLTEKVALGTCSSEISGAIGCSGEGRFANGDVKALALKANIDSSKKNGAMDFANYSMDESAWAVAKKNINDSTLYDAPKYVKPEQLKKNPAYLAMYNSVMIKLDAAKEAMQDIAKLRREGDLPAGSVAEKLWQNSKTDYQTMFPAMSYPSKPSLFELINFAVFKDFMGPDTQANQTKDEKQLLEDLNKKVALSNFVALQQYKQTENTNILLQHMLVQLTTPAKKEAVDSEYSKTMNMR